MIRPNDNSRVSRLSPFILVSHTGEVSKHQPRYAVQGVKCEQSEETINIFLRYSCSKHFENCYQANHVFGVLFVEKDAVKLENKLLVEKTSNQIEWVVKNLWFYPAVLDSVRLDFSYETVNGSITESYLIDLRVNDN